MAHSQTLALNPVGASVQFDNRSRILDQSSTAADSAHTFETAKADLDNITRDIPTGYQALRRGAQLMVIFRGCPSPSVLEALRQAQVMIGLALSPDELSTIDNMDAYIYVFLSSHQEAASALTSAVTDLLRNCWSLDPTDPGQ